MSDTLTDLLLTKAKRPRILSDCERVIEEEVRNKSGISGLAIKGSFKVIKKIKPGIVREAMDMLLDDFVARVEPFWRAHLDEGGDKDGFAEALAINKDAVADALLGITDDRVAKAKNRTIKSAYTKLRPQAKKHVTAAIPNVGRMLQAHL